MKARDDNNMVLRTVYLPQALDERIGVLARTQGVSKGDVMRELIKVGLAVSGKKTLAEQLTEAASKRKAAARRKAARTRVKTKDGKPPTARKTKATR